MNKEDIKEKLLTSNNKDSIQLRGRLILLLKKELHRANNIEQKMSLKTEIYDELKKHKEMILNRRTNIKEIKLPEKIGLKVREISTAINIFKEKHDVLGKLKNSSLGIITSGLVVGIITALSTILTGGTLTVATLATLLPTMSYIGLSNIIRMPFTETMWSRFIKKYENKDKDTKDMIDFINTNISSNSNYISLLKEKSLTKDHNQLSIINEKLVEEYKNIIDTVNNGEMKQILSFEKINVMTDLKKCYSKIKKDYIKDKNKMTNKEFIGLEKKSLVLDINLFKEKSFISDVGKQSLKNLKISTGSMYLSRIVLSSLYPSLNMETLTDVVTPFIIAVLGNVGSMGNIKEKIKMKQTMYNNQKIKFSNTQLFNDLSNPKNATMSL